MPTYISLLRFTEQGVKAIKDSPKRLEAARETFQKFGGQLKDFYLVMGEYDAIVVGEAPNDEAIAKAMLTIGSKGAVQTQTMRAFSESEYRKILGSLP